ncbi:hypothetical protein [Mycobacterium sp. MMS18-G62]
MGRKATTYQVTDLLRDSRSARVGCDQIASTVSRWLAELGADSPLVEDLARAVQTGDWAAAHAFAEYLSIDVAVAA